MPTRIFVTPAKSGTTSVGRALSDLGYRSTGWQPTLFDADQYELISEVGRAAREFRRFDRFAQVHGTSVERELRFVAEASEHYEVFDDWPLGHECLHPFAKEILFPDCTYIFLDREDRAYVDSRRRWMLSHPNIYPNAQRIWADEGAATQRSLRRRRRWRRNYEHLADVRPGSVLFMEAAHGWAPLCEFLGVAAPDTDFPHLNRHTRLRALRARVTALRR